MSNVVRLTSRGPPAAPRPPGPRTQLQSPVKSEPYLPGQRNCVLGSSSICESLTRHPAPRCLAASASGNPRKGRAGTRGYLVPLGSCAGAPGQAGRRASRRHLDGAHVYILLRPASLARHLQGRRPRAARRARARACSMRAARGRVSGRVRGTGTECFDVCVYRRRR